MVPQLKREALGFTPPLSSAHQSCLERCEGLVLGMSCGKEQSITEPSLWWCPPLISALKRHVFEFEARLVYRLKVLGQPELHKEPILKNKQTTTSKRSIQ